VVFEQFLEDLAIGRTHVTHANLMPFSGLASSDSKFIRDAWANIEPTRRAQIMVMMMVMAEDNVDLDFTSIFKMALKDDNPDIRSKAVGGLWECEERGLISVFIRLLRSDSSGQVRSAAAQGLGRFAVLAEAQELLPSDRDRIREALLEAVNLESEPLEVKRRAIEALGPFSDPEIKDLIQWAYLNPEPVLTESAIYAMGHNADPMWIPIIVKELGSSVPAMRYEAACASARFGEESIVPHLIPLLGDDDLEVALSVIRALGVIGGSVAQKSLVGCLEDEDETISEAAQRALDILDGESDVVFFHRNGTS